MARGPGVRLGRSQHLRGLDALPGRLGADRLQARVLLGVQGCARLPLAAIFALRRVRCHVSGLQQSRGVRPAGQPGGR